MTFCKLFASKLLDTPWVLHLDVYRPHLNPILAGRSRPDLVGQQMTNGQWHAFECKGRLSKPDATVKAKAKSQAQRLVSVNGTACALHIGSIAYFQSDVLQFYWRDPKPEGKGTAFKLVHDESLWRHHYGPTVDLVRAAFAGDPVGLMQAPGVMLPIEALDISVGVHPEIARLVFREQWAEARMVAGELRGTFIEHKYQPDGIAIRTGDSWYRPFDETR